MTKLEIPTIYTRAFIFLCLSNFLFSASFQMLIPELPNFLTHLGGAHYKGFIIASFTLTAGLSRPFSGKLTDTIGRVPVMILGSLVCVVCGIFYPLVTSVVGFFVLRTFHGFSTGFKPTATAAYVADLTDYARRGEAMSALGMSSSIGFSLGPALGSYVSNIYGLNGMFVLSTLSALMSVVILTSQLKETVKNKQKFSPRLLKINRKDIFEPTVIQPFVIQFIMAFVLGTLLTIVPDRSEILHISNKGLFFTVYTLSSLLIRLLAGKSSDKFGRLPIIKFVIVCSAVSMFFMAQAQTAFMFLFGGILYGFSYGLSTPTLQAWTVDLTPEVHRGRGLATMFIALEAGIGAGSIVSQAVYNNVPSQISYPFYLATCFACVGFISLFFFKKEKAFKLTT